MTVHVHSFYDWPRGMDQFLDETLHALWYNNSNVFPLVNVSKDEHNIYVDALLPGVDKQNIELTLDKNILTIEGQRDSQEASLLQQERDEGTFCKSVEFDEKVDPEKITAKLEDGWLTICLAKAQHIKERIEIEN